METLHLYKKPVYVVRYGWAEKFELKTLAGCIKRIEKQGITNYKIYKFEKHLIDPTDNKTELIKEG